MYIYVNRCEMAGFCTTDSMRIQCAQRWLAGKRKITPPFYRHKKEAEKKRNKILKNLPTELQSILDDVISRSSSIADRIKRINFCVGQTLKQIKLDPILVRQLLEERITK